MLVSIKNSNKFSLLVSLSHRDKPRQVKFKRFFKPYFRRTCVIQGCILKKGLNGTHFEKKYQKGTCIVCKRYFFFFLTKTYPAIFLGIASAFSPGRAFFQWVWEHIFY